MLTRNSLSSERGTTITFGSRVRITTSTSSASILLLCQCGPSLFLTWYSSPSSPAFCGQFSTFRQDETGLGLIYGAVIGIGLLTCVLFTVIGYRSFARANRLGPWLIYHKQSGEVELPREGEKFDRSEIVHLQYITTKLLWWGGVLNNERYSEINLVTSRDGIRKRWPLLKSGFNVKAFEWLLKPLQEQTNLPVVRVQDEWWGWKVTETPYGKTGSPR